MSSLVTFPQLENFFTLLEPISDTESTIIYNISSYNTSNVVAKVMMFEHSHYVIITYEEEQVIIKDYMTERSNETELLSTIHDHLLKDGDGWFPNYKPPYLKAYGIFTLYKRLYKFFHHIPCLIIDKVYGITFSDLFEQDISINGDDIITQLIRGLAYLHEHEIAHSDLIADNVMYEHDSNRVVLIDITNKPMRRTNPKGLAKDLKLNYKDMVVACETYSDLQLMFISDIYLLGKLMRAIGRKTFVNEKIRNIAVQLKSNRLRDRPSSLKEIMNV